MITEFTDENGTKHFVLHAETSFFGVVPQELVAPAPPEPNKETIA